MPPARQARGIGLEAGIGTVLAPSGGVFHWDSSMDHLVRHEKVLKLTAALERLPEARCETLIHQHWRGWPLAQIEVEMGRTRVAVAWRIKRAL